MSGSSGSRGDWSTGGSSDGGSSGGGGGSGGAGGIGTANPCLKKRSGPINSPKAAVLAALKVGDVLSVRVNTSGSHSVLEVLHNGQVAGSLTFLGYTEVIDCILSHSTTYRAVITKISGGFHEVSVEPV